MPFINLYYLIYNNRIYKTIILYNISMGIVSVSLVFDIFNSINYYNEYNNNRITV